jgi:hypothetical protein
MEELDLDLDLDLDPHLEHWRKMLNLMLFSLLNFNIGLYFTTYREVLNFPKVWSTKLGEEQNFGDV